MNEKTEEKKTRKIGVGLILGWTFGIIFIVAGITYLFSKPLEGICFALAGVVIFPPFLEFVKQKTNFELSWILRLIVCLVFLGIAGGTGATNLTQTQSHQSVPAAKDNTNSQPTATTPPIQAPQTLLDLAGSGTKSTQKFTAASDWDLNWSYDCSNFGYKGNFQVYIYGGDGTMSLQNVGVNQLGNKDSGVEHYHSGGTFYLEVNSECDWTVNVKG